MVSPSITLETLPVSSFSKFFCAKKVVKLWLKEETWLKEEIAKTMIIITKESESFLALSIFLKVWLLLNSLLLLFSQFFIYSNAWMNGVDKLKIFL